ncbi:MAG: GDSL-type esterase/lipase family protein [bacterium]
MKPNLLLSTALFIACIAVHGAEPAIAVTGAKDGAPAAERSASWHVSTDTLKPVQLEHLLDDAKRWTATAPAVLPLPEPLKANDSIVALGDTITAQGGYLKQMQAVFAQSLPDLGIGSIINAGVAGDKVASLVARFDKDVLAKKPTVVTINIGLDDVWQAPHDEAVLEAYRKKVTLMVEKAQASGIHVVLVSPTIIQEDPAQEVNQCLPRYVATMRAIAVEKHCGFVDLHAMLLAALTQKPADTKGNWLTSDGVHMGMRGDAIMALGILRALAVPDEKITATMINVQPRTLTPADDFEPRVFIPPGATKYVLPYRYGRPPQPEAGRRYPLILCLHGSGERGNSNIGQVNIFRPLLDKIVAKTSCYVLVPQIPGNQIWATFGWSCKTSVMQPEATPMMAMVRQLVDKIVAEESVDTDRIYVVGMSMGGYGTWEAIQRWPELFAAAVPICGGGDVTQAGKLTTLPIWAWHGDADNQISIDKTRAMIDAITAAGGHPKVTYLPKVGHNAWSKAYADPQLVEWLLQQSRVPATQPYQSPVLAGK